MEKKLLLMMGIFALMSTFILKAQVTIGKNQMPQSFSVLELVSTTGGLRLPELTSAQRDALNVSGNSLSKGLFIYNTDVDSVQFYNGTEWITPGIGGGGSASPWLISGTTTPSSSNTDSIYQMGAVDIGTSAAPDPTAILNVESTNQGVLFPRVILTSSTDSTTIPHPTKGLLVYNTGADSNFPTVGYMYWDGARWALFAAGTADAAHATLACSGATLSPTITVSADSAIPAGTLLQIPYSASNGGMYNTATLYSTGNPNVTAIIGSNVLMQGSGVLSFLVSGTPTINQVAPAGITFDLTPFLNANPGITGCNSVTVGNLLTASITSSAVMGYLALTTDNSANDSILGTPPTPTVTYAMMCNSPDGKYSIRVALVPAPATPSTYTVAQGNQTLNIQIRNNQSFSQWIIWSFGTEYGGYVGGNGVLNVQPRIWGGQSADGGGTWINQGYWGNIGIYDGTGQGPEYRRYTWIPQGATNKVSYEAHIMAAIDTSTPATAVAPTQVKCYIKFEQVTAQ